MTDKKIAEIKFHATTLGGEAMEVSEMVVMESAAGWYVGKICKTTCDDGFQLVEPYCRLTDYVDTAGQARRMLAYEQE